MARRMARSAGHPTQPPDPPKGPAMLRLVPCCLLLAASCSDAAPPDDSTATAIDDLAAACRALPDGPQPVTLDTEAVYESEELAFDGAGLLVAKKGAALV